MTSNYSDHREGFASVFDHLLEQHGVKAGHYLRDDSTKVPGVTHTQDAIAFTEGPGQKRCPNKSDSQFPEKGTVLPVLLVPGLLADSVKNLIAPVLFARAALALQGYCIDIAWVNGRSGCDLNARQLRRKVLSLSDREGSAITLIGYSKGCADAMHMLVNHPETRSSVDTLVSLAGVVGGSPLAASVSEITRALLNSFPIPGVARGDGRAIADLEPGYRRDWLKANHLPEAIRYASVIAVPEPAKVSRILLNGYRRLSATSVANDSQIIDCDAILPNSELLAVANADHWAIALPISRRYGKWVQPWVNHNDYPRTVLLQAIIEYLALQPAPGNVSRRHVR